MKLKIKRDGMFKRFPLFISQIILANVLVTIIFYGGYYHCSSIPMPTSVDLPSRLAFAVRCTLPMAAILFLSIAHVGNKRALTAAIDPLSGNENIVQLDKNFLTNTLEQFVVAFAITLAVATYLDTPEELKLLPIYTFMFVTGRIAFRIGYGLSPWLRATGMACNFYSTILMFVVLVYLISTRGFLYGIGGPMFPLAERNNNDDHEL